MPRFGPHRAALALSIVVAASVAPACSNDAGFDDYTAADLHEGGRLYDRIWADVPPDDFTDDHPLWAERSDANATTIRGSETWRCKECHGWDYLGVEGEYGTGSHRTGFPGILGTDRPPQELFRLLAEEPSNLPSGHAYSRFMRDRELWDLVKFCLEGAVATDDIIDGSGSFTTESAPGQSLFVTGVGSEPSCASCHGADGRSMPHVEDGHEDEEEEEQGSGVGSEPEHDETVGSVARDNPWEFHHKARFGHPGSPMHGYQRGGASHEDIGSLGAFAQSLP